MNTQMHDPNVLVALIGADGHMAGGIEQLSDGSFYSWLDQPGHGRQSKASSTFDDAEAALDVIVDHAEIEERTRIDRTAQIVALRAAAPMRPCNGQTEDVDGLGLFDAVRSPMMF